VTLVCRIKKPTTTITARSTSRDGSGSISRREAVKKMGRKLFGEAIGAKRLSSRGSNSNLNTDRAKLPRKGSFDKGGTGSS